MRLLVVADFHYNLRQYDWLLRMAPDYDLVIVAGDMLDLAGHVDLDTQIVVLTKYLARLRAVVPVLVCSGNHDVDSRDSAGERVAAWLQDLRDDGVRVDGEHVTVGDALVSICPYWDGPAGRSLVEGFVDTAPPRAGASWIWVYHVPPDASPISWTGRAHAGDAFLNQLIGRYLPDFVLCGHVHDSPFRKGGSWIDRVGSTWVVNPGRQLGELPPFIEIDLERRTAAWTSLAGAEERALA